jgi:hypothetical protein
MMRLNFNPTEGQARELVDRLLADADPEPLGQTEIQAVVDWLQQAAMLRGLLAGFEAGELKLRWQEGEPQFTRRAPER